MKVDTDCHQRQSPRLHLVGHDNLLALYRARR